VEDTLYIRPPKILGSRAGVAKGVAILPNFLAYIVFLCFERRCLKPNTVARLNSKYFPLPKSWVTTPLVRRPQSLLSAKYMAVNFRAVRT